MVPAAEGFGLSGSLSERAIRDHAAARLRQMRPEGRIIHELVVGGCRADLAVVEPERLTLIEIKSERDTLKRLAEQMRQFERAAHETIVIAHEHWFDTTPYLNGRPRFVPSDALRDGAAGNEVWAFPEIARPTYGSWAFRHQWGWKPEPHAARLLELLWKDELLTEAFNHRIAATGRTTVGTLIHDLAWHMTGKEIARAVCRQLRGRSFPEADAPLPTSLTA